MRTDKLLLIIAVSVAACACCVAQQANVAQLLTPTGLLIGENDADVEQLIAQADPAVQEQIAKTYAAFGRHHFEPIGHVEPFQELQKLKNAVPDQAELVRQLAIFAATPAGGEQQPLLANVILGWLRISPTVAMRVLAPYLDTDNPKLRGFVRDYFQGFGKVDLREEVEQGYLEYIRWMVNHEKEIPSPFVNYIYERSPGQALLVFRIATVDHGPYLRLLNKSIEARQQGRELTAQEREEIRQIQEARQQDGRERREIALAEHIISNAVWLHKHKFDKRFHTALPEAMDELEKLAKHEEWWARLYVVYIMRRHPVLLRDHIMRQLREDSNELVREAANFEKD